MNKPMNRRQFFTTIAQITGVAVIAPAALSAVFSSSALAQEKRRAAPTAAAGGGMPLVDPADSVAKSLHYTDDAKKSPEAKGNHCGLCGFYTKKEMRNGKEVGACTIFSGKVVYNQGWCSSFNKKA